MYGDYIFWTDWVRRAVLRADKYTGGDMKVLRADIPQQPMGIVAVANDTNNCTYHSAPPVRLQGPKMRVENPRSDLGGKVWKGKKSDAFPENVWSRWWRR